MQPVSRRYEYLAAPRNKERGTCEMQASAVGPLTMHPRADRFCVAVRATSDGRSLTGGWADIRRSVRYWMGWHLPEVRNKWNTGPCLYPLP